MLRGEASGDLDLGLIGTEKRRKYVEVLLKSERAFIDLLKEGSSQYKAKYIQYKVLNVLTLGLVRSFKQKSAKYEMLMKQL